MSFVQLYFTCILLVPAQCPCHQESFHLLSKHVVSFLPTAVATHAEYWQEGPA